ncbi:MAG: hypothetical protein ABIQ89_00070 [Candidatus Saccharimonadales bacterium]
MLQSLETKLNEMLVTKAPYQLPEGFRKWLGTYAWVFALIGAVFGAISIFPLLALAGLGTVIGSATGQANLVLFVWVSILILIGYTVLLAVATPKLKRMEKAGWNLIFYSNLFFLTYDLFNWLRFVNFSSFFGLLWNLAWAVVGFYIIFQVRSQFMPKKANKKKTDSKA